MKEIKVTRNGKTRTHLEINCTKCGKLFTRRKDLVLRKPNNYCSYRCSNEHKVEIALTSANKKCALCKEVKPRTLDFFYRKNDSKDGLTFRCKICLDKCSGKDVWKENNKDKVLKSVKNSRLTKTYGITLEDYENKLEEQKNLCSICGELETRKLNGKTLNLVIDHCHKTGKFRGLICNRCNNGLGRFKDSSHLVKKAFEYLLKFEDGLQ